MNNLTNLPNGEYALKVVTVDSETGQPLSSGSGGGGGGNAMTAAQYLAAQWEDGSYALNVDGNLVSETQVNVGTGVVRTRTWTYATQPNGDVVATPGAWA